MIPSSPSFIPNGPGRPSFHIRRISIRLPDQVPEDVVKDRFDRLLRLVQETAAEALDRNVGKLLPVLAEEKNRREEGMLTGRLTNNLTVHFRGGEELIGQIIPVQITENCGFYYLGETEGR